MTFFKTPEFATRFGALNDECIVDGQPVSAHVTRELDRNGNYLMSRGGVAFHWMPRNSTITEQARALSFAPTHWQHLINVPAVPVRKPFRINQLRCRMRMIVSNTQSVQLYIGTTLSPDPTVVVQDNLTTVTGTGAAQVVDFALVPVREAEDELLSFYIRALINPSVDPLMATGTYGTPNTGTVSSQTNGPGSFRSAGAAWNTTGNTPASGGHYVVFRNAGSTLTRFLSEIVGGSGADILLIKPETPDNRFLQGTTFDIRKVPDVQLLSIACYWVNRTN